MPALGDTPTAAALTDLYTSARGIEAHSVRAAATAVKSRWGDGSRAAAKRPLQGPKGISTLSARWQSRNRPGHLRPGGR
jgi:hypothetical protein